MLTSSRLWGTCACAALVLLLIPSCGDARAAQPQPLGETVEFRVDLDGAVVGSFRQVEGLSIEQEVVEFQNGDDPLLRKRPGRVKYGDITLKRGYVGDTTLNDWIEVARLGDTPRKTMSIVMYDNASATPIKTWNCYGCFPKSWKLSSLDGKGNDVLTEEVVIVIEWFEEA